MTSLERLAKCGRARVGSEDGQVGVVLGDGVAHYRGLATCGSVWACPVCSAKIRELRAQELEGGVLRWMADGRHVVMVTLTVRHGWGDDLATLFNSVAQGWRKTVSGRAWKDDKAAFGVRGYVRTIEVTHGANGWHPHVHALLFLDGELDRRQLRTLEARLYNRWSNAVERLGAGRPNRSNGVRAQDVERGGGGRLGRYLAKLQEGLTPGRELTRSDLKSGRCSSRTPFEILRDAAEDGCAQSFYLWREWEQASHGRRCLTWSNGCRDMLGLGDERDDQELAELEAPGEVVAVLTADEWRMILRVRDGCARVLEVCEATGGAGVRAWVNSRMGRPPDDG